MDKMKDALLRMVKAYRKIEELRSAYVKVGFKDDYLFDVAGDIEEAIYKILGEDGCNKDFIDSVTHVSLNAPYLTNERRTEMLYSEYKKNHIDFPKPNIMSSDGMKELYARNGGYMFRETPEGDWS